MNKITIVRVGSPQSPSAHREYCGKPGKGHKGIFGNPFWMGNESQRNWACDTYQNHFEAQMFSRTGDLYIGMRQLYRIAKERDLELACFCVPKRCHCETIKNFLEEKLNGKT